MKTLILANLVQRRITCKAENGYTWRWKIQWIELHWSPKASRSVFAFIIHVVGKVDGILRYSFTAKRNLSISKSISASIAPAFVYAKLSYFIFFPPIEFLYTVFNFFQSIENGRHNRQSSRIFICHTLGAVTRLEWRYYHPYFLCALSKNDVGDVVSLLLWCRRWPPCFVPITSKHTFHSEKRLLSFRPFRIHGMCVCVWFFFFSFVLSERKPSCLRVFQFY